MVVVTPPTNTTTSRAKRFSPRRAAARQHAGARWASRAGNRRGRGYLTEALKCRPPASRSASAEEAAQCEPYLARQVELVQPRIILAMGRIAAQSLLQSKAPLGRLRGQVHQYRGVPLIATYDLGYLLRTPAPSAKPGPISVWRWRLCAAPERTGRDRV